MHPDEIPRLPFHEETERGVPAVPWRLLPCREHLWITNHLTAAPETELVTVKTKAKSHHKAVWISPQWYSALSLGGLLLRSSNYSEGYAAVCICHCVLNPSGRRSGCVQVFKYFIHSGLDILRETTLQFSEFPPLTLNSSTHHGSFQEEKSRCSLNSFKKQNKWWYFLMRGNEAFPGSKECLL